MVGSRSDPENYFELDCESRGFQGDFRRVYRFYCFGFGPTLESLGKKFGSGLFPRRGMFFDNFSSEGTKVSSGEENFSRSRGYAAAEGLQPLFTEWRSGGAGFIDFLGSIGYAAVRAGNGRGVGGYGIGRFRGY